MCIMVCLCFKSVLIVVWFKWWLWWCLFWLLCLGLDMKVIFMEKLLFILNFLLELSLLVKFCKYFCNLVLFCLNLLIVNIVDWKVCEKWLDCMVKCIVWWGWRLGRVFICVCMVWCNVCMSFLFKLLLGFGVWGCIKCVL